MSFHPDLQSVARWLPRGVANPWSVRLLRLLPTPRPKLPAGVTATERPLPGGGSVRILAGPAPSPAALRPAILWIHGGGYVIGAARQDDPVCARLALALDAVVVSVDYRLAPEHPFPTPVEDCFAAYSLLHAEAAAIGIDPARVAIAGRSAGGGLAAALALLVHDRGAPAPALQLLVYPMIDDRTVARPEDTPHFRLWNGPSNRYGWACYLGREPGGDDVPEHAAPARRQDLRGLPPAWVGVGTRDLFHDEDLAYAARLRDAGVPVTVEVVEGAFHGFDAVAPDAPVSRAFFAAQVAALRAAVGAPDGGG